MSFVRFFAMIAVSTVVMFGLMYLNTYALDDVRFSQTRAWMALMMGAVMALIMLGFMWDKYRPRQVKLAIMALAAFAAAGSLAMVRSQAGVGDVGYMKAMIPHHSIAVMTSRRAHIRDPQVRALADGIITTQLREIDQMNAMIARLERTPRHPGRRTFHQVRSLSRRDAAARRQQASPASTLTSARLRQAL